MNIVISLAKNEQLAALRIIELASFEELRKEGAVTGEPIAGSIDDFKKLSQKGILFVASTSDDIPIGFAGAFIIDNWLHISEVDVHPDWQRRGIGRCLIKKLLSEGQARGCVGSSLTTDRFAPFNAPFYSSLGFKIMGENEIQQWLKKRLDEEIASGLNPKRRVAMQLYY